MMSPKSKSKSERMADAAFAKGGSKKMFSEQAAGAVKPGQTGKQPNPAPGKRAASGGPRTTGVSVSTPSKPGRTAPTAKGR